MPKDPIQRAREFAALADKATPGPWMVVFNGGAFITAEEVIVLDGANSAGLDAKEEDLAIAAAAPDMAKLLAEMADELEDVSRLVDKAAGVIGTADEYRSTACWCARLKDEVKTLRSKTNELERTRKALRILANAADPFLADQSQATDERVALVQPVTVKEAEELNAACKEAREVLDEAGDA